MKGAEITIRLPGIVRAFVSLRELTSGLIGEGDHILLFVCESCGYIEVYKRQGSSGKP